MLAAQILASRGRSLGKYPSSLPKLVATRIGSSCRFSTIENDSEPKPPKRHPQSFVSPDVDLKLGELETELPPGFHTDRYRRDRGTKKPRPANDGKDSYWRPPWNSPRAEIISAEDFANRPRVTFSESFASMHDAMAVLSWMPQADKDGMYELYCNMMTSLAAAQEKESKDTRDQEWGALSAHTSHEYVVRVIAQEYNVTTSRAAGVIQLQHNEEQLKKDPDFTVNHSLQAHVDKKIRENIADVYKSYGEKDPLQFVEDPVASTGTVGREDYGSPSFVQASELTDVDALVKKTRMMEIADAKVRIANHIYVEDVDERTRNVKYDQEVARLLKMKKEMERCYDGVTEGDAVEGDREEDEEEIQAFAGEDEEEEKTEAPVEENVSALEREFEMIGSRPKRWVGKRANSVFVHNLLYAIASQELKDHMSAAGDVVDAEVLTTPEGQSLGWGIVTFATSEAAEEAIKKLHDTDLKGQKIGVEKPKGFDYYFEEDAKEFKEEKGMWHAKNGEVKAKISWKRWEGKRENSVFVRNLPSKVVTQGLKDQVSQDLKDHMCTVGDVVDAYVLTTKIDRRKTSERGLSLGSAIVEFATPEVAKDAIEKLNGTIFNGRKLRMEEVKDFEEAKVKEVRAKNEEAKVKEARSKRWAGKRENSVFVRNLPLEITPQDLKDHMCTAGDIVDAHFLKKKQGRSSLRAFVEFADPQGAKEAIKKLNDTHLKGWSIEVKSAVKGAETPPKSWGKSLWENRLKSPEAPPNSQRKSKKQGQTTKVPKLLKIPVGASPYPENNRGHKEDPETRRPRWKYTAQIVNTHMQENPPGSKRHGKAVAALAKGRRHGRIIDGNTIIEQDGELRVASVAELEKTSWKHVRNESEFMFRGVKEAWLKRQLEGEVGGWGVQEEVNRPKPAMVEGKKDGDVEGEGEEATVVDEEGGAENKE